MSTNYGPASSGYVYCSPTTTWLTLDTTNPCVPTILSPSIIYPTTSGALAYTFAPTKPPTALSPAQIAFLLAEHRFIPMDGSDYCLFCYALDVYRRTVDHLFVITEE